MDGVRTGDLLLFSSNTPTGFLLRTFTSSQWNHVGVAVRMKEGKVSRDDGKLYVLEINTLPREDAVTHEMTIGAGYSDMDWVQERYNVVAVRRLREIFRTANLEKSAEEFAAKYRGYRFTSTKGPFVSVWLGIPFARSEPGEMFCTELATHFYQECVGSQIKNITGRSYSGNLTELFGKESPDLPCLFTPEHYTTAMTPNAPIFIGSLETVYRQSSGMLEVLAAPFLITLLVLFIIFFSIWRTCRHRRD